MQLISDTLKEGLWEQLVSEKKNANLYLYIAGYLRNKGLDNIAKLFISQHEEEISHSLQIFDFLTHLNIDVYIGEIPSVDFVCNTAMDIANKYLETELATTESLEELKQLAIADGNGVAEVFLLEMIKQQIHEYEESTTFKDKIELLGDNWAYILLWDTSLGG